MPFVVEMAEAGHHVIKSVAEPADNWAPNLPPSRQSGYELLPYIDPYGMTMFNGPQLSKFLEEWRRLAAEGKGDATFFQDVEAPGIGMSGGTALVSLVHRRLGPNVPTIDSVALERHRATTPIDRRWYDPTARHNSLPVNREGRGG